MFTWFKTSDFNWNNYFMQKQTELATELNMFKN